jgi:hypothetical protein
MPEVTRVHSITSSARASSVARVANIALADQQCRESAGEAHQQDARSYYDDQID